MSIKKRATPKPLKIIKEPQPLLLRQVKPRTKNQNKIFESFRSDQNIFIHGFPGTGKTYLSLYNALNSVLLEDGYDKVVVVRSAVPSRDQGYLPGNEKEKEEIYKLPIKAIINEEFFGRKDAYNFLENSGKIEFLSTSYLRGITIRDAVIIVDEVQNLNWGEINTIITRTGEGCKVILCGDSGQNDLIYLREESCISNLKTTINKIRSFNTIEMGLEDIMRGGLVKEWLAATIK